jgi:hypothetical protein
MHSVLIAMANWIMLFREIIAIISENHKKHNKCTVWAKIKIR